MKKLITTALATMDAAYGYSQSYLPLTGGTLTGNLTAPTVYSTDPTILSSDISWIASFYGDRIIKSNNSAVRSFLGLGSAAYLNSNNLIFGGTSAGINIGVDANNLIKAGFYSGYNGLNVPQGDFGFVSIPNYAGIHSGEKYNLQIGANIGQSSNLLFRTTDASGTGTWTNVWTAKNFNPNDYLPVIGGKLNGSLGIAVNNLDADAKLTVGGKIHSQEVKVTVAAGADFVFQKEYNLKPLAEVEKYISFNNHLPEIASADEMKKNGLELGEMNIKLLQKIEELTLYMIGIDKKMETLHQENQTLKKEMAELKAAK